MKTASPVRYWAGLIAGKGKTMNECPYCGKPFLDPKDSNIVPAIVTMHEIISELNWYFQNVKAYCMPYHYKNCLETALRYAEENDYQNARVCIADARKIRKEYGVF